MKQSSTFTMYMGYNIRFDILYLRDILKQKKTTVFLWNVIIIITEAVYIYIIYLFCALWAMIECEAHTTAINSTIQWQVGLKWEGSVCRGLPPSKVYQ